MKQRFVSHLILAAALVAPLACRDRFEEETYKLKPVEARKTSLLPVVFHVFYADENDASQKVPAERLKQVLNNVNKLYEGAFSGAETTDVMFGLVAQDASGQWRSSTNVNYVKVDKDDYPIDPYELMNDKTGKWKKHMWDPNKYVNVYVYHFKQVKTDAITLGISHMPVSSRGNHELEGLQVVAAKNLTKDNLPTPFCVSVNSLYVNNESNRYNDWPNLHSISIDAFDFNVTLAHELGHYIGLFHTFGEENGKSIDGLKDTDYCKDTPTYNKVAYDRFLVDYFRTHNTGNARLDDVLKRTDSEGKTFVSSNIMDYAFTLGHAFTKNQTERMVHVLNYSPLIPETGRRTRAVKTRVAPKGIVNIKFVVVE